MFTGGIAENTAPVRLSTLDALAGRSTEELIVIQKRTLKTTAAALDVVLKLFSQVIVTYALLMAPPR
ncbi:hypothetical protein ABAC460_01920 [Asticcacaulis sp. AC460]|nr:hypothetical protein ABAC460_01920 [Asticcacaulis sp. AC460]